MTDGMPYGSPFGREIARVTTAIIGKPATFVAYDTVVGDFLYNPYSTSNGLLARTWRCAKVSARLGFVVMPNDRIVDVAIKLRAHDAVVGMCWGAVATGILRAVRKRHD